MRIIRLARSVACLFNSIFNLFFYLSSLWTDNNRAEGWYELYTFSLECLNINSFIWLSDKNLTATETFIFILIYWINSKVIEIMI